MIKPTVMELIPTPMDLSIKEDGKMTSSMVKVLKNGLTVHPTKGTTLMERNTALVSLFGAMEVPTQVNSSTTISMAKVFTNGMMEESSMESGRTTKWRDTVPSLGQTTGSM